MTRITEEEVKRRLGYLQNASTVKERALALLVVKFADPLALKILRKSND